MAIGPTAEFSVAFSSCLPMRDNCSGVVSLFDMLQFYGDALIFEVSALHFAKAKLGFEKSDSHVLPAAGAMVYAKLGVLSALFDLYGMKSSAAQCKRVIAMIEAKGPNIRCGELYESLKQLRERSEDEFKAEFFIHLTPDEARLYQNPTKNWQEVSSRFYKVKFNIEESAKCFALGRFGASVFHILQVAEYGVIKVADLMGVSGDKPGWGSLQKIQDLIKIPYAQRTDLVKQHSKFLENVVPLAFVIKDRWRHKLDHVDNQIVWNDTDFGPEVADEIIKATRGFMRNLAKELPR
jgi:hypothetical protein